MENARKLADLLPVQEHISHNGVDLFIQERIGEGYTSIVYKGRLDDEDNGVNVAIKAIKSNRNEDDFNQEFLTLSSLQTELINSLKDFPNTSDDNYLDFSVQISPKFFGASKYSHPTGQNVPYIVMEFIQGTPVSELIEKNTKLPEAQALIIAWQFYYLLHTLHNKLHKTYSDIKIDNLIWQEPTEGQKSCLRVLDLGNLYELRENALFFGNPKNDIFRAANILLRMLTGRSINIKPTAYVEDLPQLLNNENISWGTKRFLRQSLHWKESERYIDTQRIVHNLSKLVSAWESDRAILLNEVSMKLDKAEERVALLSDSDSRNIRKIPQAEEARNMLGIIEAQTKQKEDHLDHYTADMISRADFILGWESYFNIGQEFLKGSSYERAKEAFRKGLYNSENPTRIRRYYYLASIAVDLNERFSEVKETLYDVVHCMETEKFDTGKKIIRTIDESFQRNEYIDALRTECELNTHLIAANEAERISKFHIAASEFEQAYQQLINLPDYEEVQLLETGDIRAMYIEMLSMEETVGKAEEKLTTLQSQYVTGEIKDISVIINGLHTIWKRNPLVPEIRAFLVKVFDNEIKTHQFQNAIQLAESATLMDDPQIWNSKLALSNALAGLYHQILMGNFSFFVDRVVYLANQNNGDLFILSILQGLVEQYFSMRSVRDFPDAFIQDIETLSSNGLIDKESISDKLEEASWAKSEISNSRKKLIDDYLITLEYIEQLDNLGPILGKLMLHEALYLFDKRSRLDKAIEIVRNAMQLSLILDHYRVEEIEAWNDRIGPEIKQSEDDPLQINSVERWRKIEKEFENLTLLYEQPPADNIFPSYYEFVTLKGQKLLLEILDFQATFAPEAPQAEKLYHEVADLMDHYKSGWLRIEIEAQNRTRSLRESKEFIRKTFFAGGIDEVLTKIADLERQYSLEDVSPLHFEMNPMLVQTKKYLDYVKEHTQRISSKDYSDPSFFTTIWTFAANKYNGEYSIPRIYFSEELSNFLKNYRSHIFNSMIQCEPSYDEVEAAEIFANYTVEYKLADSILRMIKE